MTMPNLSQLSAFKPGIRFHDDDDDEDEDDDDEEDEDDEDDILPPK